MPAPHDALLPQPALQARSRLTARSFIEAARYLLAERTFSELSVAELAAQAGRSVGVFYQRFGSKDDFLHVLLTAFFEEALEWRTQVKPEGALADIYAIFLAGGYRDIVENRNLWHAALERSALDPGFWKLYGGYRTRMNAITAACLEQALGRPFTEAEARRLAMAGQVFNSVINNQIINGPGPLVLEDPGFLDEMTRIALSIGPFEGQAQGGA